MSRDRAISTVMDVSLALLIVSATVLMIGIFLHSDDGSIDGDRADRAYQTLSGSTVTISYDMTRENESGHAPIESEHFDQPEGLEPDETPELYTVTVYDAATALLVEAALVNVEYDGRQPLAYGDEVERSVDAGTRGQLVGADDSIYAVATWEPYANSTINGSATIGDRPPRSADISSTSATVSTRLSGVDHEAIAEGYYATGVDGAAAEIAALIVDALFPVAQTQYTLESTLTENSITKYDYRKLALAFGGEDLEDDVDDEITGTNPNTENANELLADALAETIAEDMRDDPVRDDLERTRRANRGDLEGFTQDAEPLLEGYVAVETVDITVQATE
ncbi:DUF7284 family protein [Salinadaptatus halalkaliphilus]|uniref:DUF7284 family protein n=1 Tax=Salinadaptatus halalkaliphilus TaxID=2419781 RepID=UPI001FE9C03B|nr:hypothetical protein [Salinadaptatus halalkaliphilus]